MDGSAATLCVQPRHCAQGRDKVGFSFRQKMLPGLQVLILQALRTAGGLMGACFVCSHRLHLSPGRSPLLLRFNSSHWEQTAAFFCRVTFTRLIYGSLARGSVPRIPGLCRWPRREQHSLGWHQRQYFFSSSWDGI